MSEFGVKIKNYEAAFIYGNNIGIRDFLESKDAMLVNSLFLDFLLENGLNIHKDSTRDVICLEFSQGSKSCDGEIGDHRSYIKKARKRYDEKKITEKELSDIEFNRSMLIEKCEERRERYKPISKQDLRILYYEEGVTITYKSYNNRGKVIKEEPIHYKMLYRTPGKAKKGTCMFIREELYEVAHNFLYMGIQLPEKNAPIVEIGAYASLITSSIIGYVQIKPEQMLIVKDLPTSITTSAIKVMTTGEDKHCITERVSNYDLTGEAFDGQALLDLSLFPDWGDGYVLLRQHMTKCAAFASDIVQFMKDQYGEEYETATVTDMFGREVRIKDVRFITTNNAIKWLKFGVSFDYWVDWVSKNGYKFGVVKTSHKSKLGNVQRMSYQMTNALDINTMDRVSSKSVEYIENLKSNDESYFLEYLKRNTNFSNDYEVLLALVEWNPDFVKSEYYRERKKAIIRAYVLDFKGGRMIQNADNLTIVGSPYAMLLHSIGIDARTDPTFELEKDAIQCWCAKFEDGEYLAEFRSPFNSRNNLGHIHNHYHEYFDKYFKLGKLCLAVNTIDTDWQPRNNGADQDSDSCYTSNQPDIVSHAKYCYENYPTVVNEIKPEKNSYDYSLKSYAIIDNTLTACQIAIGRSSNLAQISLTYTYNFNDEKYENYSVILAVLAQVAIDNAKRKFEVDLEKEIDRISKELDINTNGLPKFWLITKKDKRKSRNDKEKYERQKENKNKIKEKLNNNLNCPMNYLYDLDLQPQWNSMSSGLSMDNFFIPHELTEHRRKCKKVEELIEKYSIELQNFHMNNDGTNWSEDSDDYLLVRADFDQLIYDIRGTYISKNYAGLMSWLINRAFRIGSGAKSKKDMMDSKIHKNKSLLMKVLYVVNKDVFLSCFTQNIVDNDKK